MTDTTELNDNAGAAETTTTQALRDKAGDLRDKATSLLQEGIDLVKNNPGAAAAVVGGVAATAAAAVAGTVYRDKIVAAVKGDTKKPGAKSEGKSTSAKS